MAVVPLVGQVVNRRRVDRDKVRVLAALMIEYPGATVAEYAERLGVSRRTLERWRKYEAFEVELREQSQRHYQNTLVPLALDAAKRILQNPGARADSLVIEILRSQGLLGIPRVDVHHAGVVVTENGDSLLEAIRARIAEVREQQALRALPAGDVLAAPMIIDSGPDEEGEAQT